MIVKTPVYNVESDKCNNSIIATRLKLLELSVSSLIKETKERGDGAITPLNTHHISDDSSNSSETINSTKNRFPDAVGNGVPMNNAVTYVPSMNNKANNWVPMYNAVNGPFKNNVVNNSSHEYDIS